MANNSNRMLFTFIRELKINCTKNSILTSFCKSWIWSDRMICPFHKWISIKIFVFNMYCLISELHYFMHLNWFLSCDLLGEIYRNIQSHLQKFSIKIYLFLYGYLLILNSSKRILLCDLHCIHNTSFYLIIQVLM